MPPLGIVQQNLSESPRLWTAGAEFPIAAAEPPPEVSRRDFLKVATASVATMGLVGCLRQSADRIVPYVRAPENLVPGIAQHYATAIARFGFARGILVESHEGRPTKIEGNPGHPESLGSTDAVTQAAVWDLYDPVRLKAPERRGSISTWGAFDAEWKHLTGQAAATAILSTPTTSPSLLALLHSAKRDAPGLRWYQHTAMPHFAFNGRQSDYDFASADVVIFVGTDCLFAHPAALRYARAFSSRRTGRQPNRVYGIEAVPTLTGIQSDWRLPARPDRFAPILAATHALVARNQRLEEFGLLPSETHFVRAMASALKAHAPRAICVVGEQVDQEARHWGDAINESLGAPGVTVSYSLPIRSDKDAAADGELAELASDIASRSVQALLILGGNPAYDSAGPIRFIEGMKNLAWSAHLTLRSNETTALCQWALPESHFLEAWSDLRAFDGTRSIVQPLIEPLLASRSASEVVASLTRDPKSSYDLVREFWAAERSDANEAAWGQWLREGIVDRPSSIPVDKPESLPQPIAAKPGAFGLVLYPDPVYEDGAGASNLWLQELPKPLTKLVWDNALLISPEDARKLDISNGNLISIATGENQVVAAAWVLRGQAEGCLALSLGGGRKAHGADTGFNAYPLRPSNTAWFIPSVVITKVGGTYSLVTTQHHFEMEGRDLIRYLEYGQPSAPVTEETQSLFPSWSPGEYAWGMVIDLSACLGCNACVIACQAENNTPTVGKDQVSRGREMHWLRIDQYFESDIDNPRIIHQPVACVHCEKAPCELVCPVGATVHSSEGLNEMVYNRCVGTRYCSNNCPYKVRRFNFLDFRDPAGSPENLQRNPNVSIRSRGVMEKCTYCVQRINEARIAAEKVHRVIADGAVRTACEQACPSRAITFGNLADPRSAVSLMRTRPGRYRLLEEQNTRPRTSYLPKLRYATESPQ